jgi:Ca-activated chloride channel family protein
MWTGLRACALLLVLGGCGHSTGGDDGRGAGELVILASNEVRDLEFLKGPMEAAVGAPIRFDFCGAVEMADRLRDSAAAQPPQVDLAWPASGIYMRLNAPRAIIAATSITWSPVVLGLKKDRAAQLGWDRNPPSWEEIAQAVVKENLTLGMTSPIASDLGLDALLSVALATAQGPRRQPTASDLAQLKALYSGSGLIGGSGGWLAEAYIKQEDRLDGMINYESRILAANAGGELEVPLAIVHPRDGALQANHPLMLINPQRRKEFNRLSEFLLSRNTQQQIMNASWRRPAIRGLPVPSSFGAGQPVALKEPAQLDYVDAMLDLYQSQLRVPAHSYFVLDVSGSMAEEHRMDQLKDALGVLAGSDQRTAGGRYARFQPREKTDLTTFDSKIVDHLAIDFGDAAGYPAATQKFRDFVGGLQPRGGTAIFDAVQAAYTQALKDRKHEPDYYPTIVLMTDGNNSSGSTLEAFQKWYDALPDGAQDIPVFTIMFGDSDADEMNALAEITGGRVFDAKSAGLTAVFKEIRGYE